MKQAYAPALQLSHFANIRKTRELPLRGKALVAVGDQVQSSTPVLQADLPGELLVVRIANRLGFEPEDVVAAMKVHVGDSIQRGQVLCELKTFFGLFTSRLLSPVEGTAEFFTELNAHLGVRQESSPLTVSAYISGEVVEVEEGTSVTIQTRGAFAQGIFGVGGERHGSIFPLPCAVSDLVEKRLLDSIGEDLTGKILIGGSGFTTAALEAAERRRVSCVICGSIDAETLATFAKREIGVSVTGDEEVPFTLIITEGFGSLPISPRFMELAQELAGKNASVNGATQVRAGATRPELIVPREATVGQMDDIDAVKVLEIGAKLRVIRYPYFGRFGVITELPSEPQRIPTGASVRVLTATLDDGEVVAIPRANVELV